MGLFLVKIKVNSIKDSPKIKKKKLNAEEDVIAHGLLRRRAALNRQQTNGAAGFLFSGVGRTDLMRFRHQHLSMPRTEQRC